MSIQQVIYRAAREFEMEMRKKNLVLTFQRGGSIW